MHSVANQTFQFPQAPSMTAPPPYTVDATVAVEPPGLEPTAIPEAIPAPVAVAIITPTSDAEPLAENVTPIDTLEHTLRVVAESRVTDGVSVKLEPW
jgi:hypothetical protein